MNTRADIANETNRKLYQNHMASMAKLREARLRIEALETIRDHAYRERNHLAAFLSHLYPAGIEVFDNPELSQEWFGCVYVDLPTGQVSWHYNEHESHLFSHLKTYNKKWDGHSSDEKYDRLMRAAKMVEWEAQLYRKRIHQLADALRKIIAMTPDPEFGTPPIDSAIEVAREALGVNGDYASNVARNALEKKDG